MMEESISDEREIKKDQIYLVRFIFQISLQLKLYFLKHMFVKIAPCIVSQNDVYSVLNNSRYNALFIDSKINQFF